MSSPKLSKIDKKMEEYKAKLERLKEQKEQKEKARKPGVTGNLFF